LAVDIDLEADVLAACLKDKKFVRKALPVLRVREFSNRWNSWIWKMLLACYNTYSDIPSIATWEFYLQHEWRNDDDRNYARATLRGLWERPPQSSVAALGALRKYVTVAYIRKVGGESLHKVEQGDINGAIETFLGSSAWRRQIDEEEESLSHAAGLPERLKRWTTPDATPRVPTFSYTVNKWLRGGLKTRRAHNVGQFFANTNVGKTAMMTDTAYNGLMSRPDIIVCHGTTEESKQEVADRHDARFVHISREHMSDGTVPNRDIRAVLEKYAATPEVMERLFIKEFQQGTPITFFQNWIEEKREDFPDHIILGILDMPEHFTGQEYDKEYQRIASVYWTLKAMAMDPALEPFGMWVAGHAKADAAKKKVMVAEDQGGAYAKSQIVDVQIGLRVTDHKAPNPDHKVVEARITKNRLGPARNESVMLDADFDRCIFVELALDNQGESAGGEA
jgi:hypothetical protein